jgi:maleamate amidohydrolase
MVSSRSSSETRSAIGTPAPHEANLFDMDAKYGDVVSESEAIDYLNRMGARREQG